MCEWLAKSLVSLILLVVLPLDLLHGLGCLLWWVWTDDAPPTRFQG